ncbi:MFS transporter [Gordonia jinghuaiqii]|uniref:MFS transporter n=1 Tax=Gordonia jinghuaiqii TaxID=2758710 RepID=A0A7D7R0N8_9ACTN|nr:MFS transporter [Gordonia jinghuaiqii]
MSTVGTPSPDATSRLGLVILAMTVGNAVILVSQTAVPLALPAIMDEFGVGSSSVQWVPTASLLPLAGLMVLGGRLGDLFGLRRVFTLGSIVFAAASLAAGLAPHSNSWWRRAPSKASAAPCCCPHRWRSCRRWPANGTRAGHSARSVVPRQSPVRSARSSAAH